jgi:hypothetical protein
LIRQLRCHGSKDIISEDVYINNNDARRVMGILMKIKYEHHVLVLKELKDLGLIERVNKDIIKIKGSDV